jgi:hypothetical protein
VSNAALGCATIWACRCSPILSAVSGRIVSVSETAWAITSARSGGRSDRSAAALATLSFDSRMAQISALSSSRMGRSFAVSIAARRGHGSVPSPMAASAFSPSRAMGEICGSRISSASCMPRGMISARLSSAPVNSPHDIGQRGAVDLAEARHGARQHALMRGRELVDAGRDAMRSNSRTITAAFCRRVMVAGVMSFIGPARRRARVVASVPSSHSTFASYPIARMRCDL